MRDLDKPPGNARIAAALLDVLTAAGDSSGRTRAERALEDGTPPRRRRSDWIDTERLRDAFRAASVGPQLARRVGRMLVAPQAIGLVLRYTGIATPEKAYRRVDRLLARQERGDRFAVDRVDEGHARIEFHPARATTSDVLFCAVRLGMLEAITPLYGLLPARVRETSCAHRGAAACVYEVSWRRTPRSGLVLGSLVGAVLGGAAGAGLAMLMGLAGPLAVTAGVLVALTGAAAGRAVDLARQLDAVARGGLGHLALLDQADGVLAEKMDLLAKLERAGAEPAVERSLGSSPLRGPDSQPRMPGTVRRLHQPVAALQRAHAELREQLQGELEESPALRTLLDDCSEATRELQGIGADALVEDGGRPVLEPADLADILYRGIEAARPRQPQGVEIRVQVDRSPAPVRCQPFQLEQVVVQLVSNAFDAMTGRRGRVDVELRECPEGFELAVADEGEGIDPEILDSLFDPFFEKPAGADAGLGLTICYRIVQQHGGELAVHSEPGRGTRVAAVLPADLQDG